MVKGFKILELGNSMEVLYGGCAAHGTQTCPLVLQKPEIFWTLSKLSTGTSTPQVSKIQGHLTQTGREYDFLFNNRGELLKKTGV